MYITLNKALYGLLKTVLLAVCWHVENLKISHINPEVNLQFPGILRHSMVKNDLELKAYPQLLRDVLTFQPTKSQNIHNQIL